MADDGSGKTRSSAQISLVDLIIKNDGSGKTRSSAQISLVDLIIKNDDPLLLDIINQTAEGRRSTSASNLSQSEKRAEEAKDYLKERYNLIAINNYNPLKVIRNRIKTKKSKFNQSSNTFSWYVDNSELAQFLTFPKIASSTPNLSSQTSTVEASPSLPRKTYSSSIQTLATPLAIINRDLNIPSELSKESQDQLKDLLFNFNAINNGSTGALNSAEIDDKKRKGSFFFLGKRTLLPENDDLAQQDVSLNMQRAGSSPGDLPNILMKDENTANYNFEKTSLDAYDGKEIKKRFVNSKKKKEDPVDLSEAFSSAVIVDKKKSVKVRRKRAFSKDQKKPSSEIKKLSMVFEEKLSNLDKLVSECELLILYLDKSRSDQNTKFETMMFSSNSLTVNQTFTTLESTTNPTISTNDSTIISISSTQQKIEVNIINLLSKIDEFSLSHLKSWSQKLKNIEDDLFQLEQEKKRNNSFLRSLVLHDEIKYWVLANLIRFIAFVIWFCWQIIKPFRYVYSGTRDFFVK